MKKIVNFIIFLSAIIFNSVYFFPAQAADKPISKDLSYQGSFIKQSIADPVIFSPGETKQVVVTMKNIGTTTWAVSGVNYVSVYTIQPSYRISLFANKNWLNKNQPAKLTTLTKTGQQAAFTLSLTAPNKSGEYSEWFQLAAENKTWIKGTGFFIKIEVVESDKNFSTKPAAIPTSSTFDSNQNHRAQTLLPSPTDLQLKGGETTRLILSFKNIGTTRWEEYSLEQNEGKNFRSEDTYIPNFSDTSWISAKKIVSGNSIVENGEILQIEFSVRAPAKKGQYLAQFELNTNNQKLSGGTINIPVIVTEDGENNSSEPIVSLPTSLGRELISEPTIRVGLYATAKEVRFKSEFPYQVFAGQEIKGTLPNGELAELSYQNGMYSFKSATVNFTTSQILKLIPENQSSYFTLVNYERTVSGRNKNFNMYRGSLEFKYSAKSSAPYVINELPLDEYVAGVAETSDGSPVEYNKALQVAVRSYGYHHLSTRSSQDLFDVYPTTASQLYLGYNSELLMPKVVQATLATKGEMVTYNGKPVVTPYYSRSDGRTRSWKEVWGGNSYPWLQSVEAVYDKGKSMYGHGVGMSGSDALQRASKDSWTYDQILKYYYSGTNVEKIY